MPVQLINLSWNENDAQFCEKVAKKSGFDFALASSPAHLNELLIERPQSLLFIEIDAPEPLRSSLSVFSKYLKPRHIFGLAAQSVFELPESSQTRGIGHYCVRNYSDFAVEWISRLCIPLFSQEPFGIEYYKDQDAVIQSITLKNSVHKGPAIEAIGKTLTKRNLNDRALQMILRVLDELLMNAIFDAPLNATQQSYRRETPRDEAFDLNEQEQVTLSVAFNQNFVTISVRDHFGSFSLDKAFAALSRNYSVSSYQVNQNTRSASLGLHGIASNGVGIMISCKPGMATEAVISFPYYSSFKETKQAFRSFSFNIR